MSKKTTKLSKSFLKRWEDAYSRFFAVCLLLECRGSKVTKNNLVRVERRAKIAFEAFLNSIMDEPLSV